VKLHCVWGTGKEEWSTRMEQWWNDNDWENRRTDSITCHTVTLSIINPHVVWPGLESEPPRREAWATTRPGVCFTPLESFTSKHCRSQKCLITGIREAYREVYNKFQENSVRDSYVANATDRRTNRWGIFNRRYAGIPRRLKGWKSNLLLKKPH
jgi:hypothetical protein